MEQLHPTCWGTAQANYRWDMHSWQCLRIADVKPTGQMNPDAEHWPFQHHPDFPIDSPIKLLPCMEVITCSFHSSYITVTQLLKDFCWFSNTSKWALWCSLGLFQYTVRSYIYNLCFFEIILHTHTLLHTLHTFTHSCTLYTLLHTLTLTRA